MWSLYKAEVMLLLAVAFFQLCDADDSAGGNMTTRNMLFIPAEDGAHVIIAVTSVQEPSFKGSCSNETTTEALLHSQAFFYGHELLKTIAEEQMAMLVIDICGSPLLAVNMLTRVFSQNPSQLIDDSGEKHLVDWSRFSAVITDQPSSTVSAIYPYLNQLNIPIISTRARSSWLFDVDRYPLLLNLQSPNHYETKTLLELAQRDNMQALALVHTSNQYGVSAKSSFLAQAQSYNVCIEQVLEMKVTSQSIAEMALQLGTNSSLPRVFVLLMDSRSAAKLLRQIYLHDLLWSKRGKIILGGSTFADLSDTDSFHSYKKLYLGSLYLSSSRDSVPELDIPITSLIEFWNTANTTRGANSYLSTLLSNRDFCHIDPDENEFSLCPSPCSTPCLASTKLAASSNFKDIVAVYMALGYSISDSKYNQEGDMEDILSPGVSDVARFWRRLPGVLIPSSTDSTEKIVAPFKHQPAYFVWNIVQSGVQEHDKVRVLRFSYVDGIDNGNVYRYHDVQYYIHGTVDKSFSSSCLTKECQCRVQFVPKASSCDLPANDWFIVGVVFLSLFVALTIFVLLCIAVTCRTPTRKGKDFRPAYFSPHKSKKKIYHPIPRMRLTRRADEPGLGPTDSISYMDIDEGGVNLDQTARPPVENIELSSEIGDRPPSLPGSVQDLESVPEVTEPPEIAKRTTQKKDANDGDNKYALRDFSKLPEPELPYDPLPAARSTLPLETRKDRDAHPGVSSGVSQREYENAPNHPETENFAALPQHSGTENDTTQPQYKLSVAQVSVQQANTKNEPLRPPAIKAEKTDNSRPDQATPAPPTKNHFNVSFFDHNIERKDQLSFINIKKNIEPNIDDMQYHDIKTWFE